MTLQNSNDWEIISPSINRLDVKSVPQFKQDCVKQLAGSTHIVLDLHLVQFIDSTGIGCLLQLLKQQESLNLRLALTGINEQVDAMFKLVHMDQRFEITDDPQTLMSD